MNLHQLGQRPVPELERALTEFEAQFTYPLGPGRTFRISHGTDYPRFFRAIGLASSFIAETQGRVLGVVGVAVRQLLLPDGNEWPAAYIGDLKVAVDARGGRVLARLARASEAWLRPRVSAAYGVVMDGTAATPTAYTGRAGIPAFQAVGKVIVLRLATDVSPPLPGDERFSADRERVLDCYRRLSHGRVASLGGSPAERSEVVPTWLLHPDGLACGLLEDTRKAKRLLADDGSEMLSGHLSSFAYRTPAAGADLLGVALRQAARLGFPALFVAVAAPDAEALGAALGQVNAVVAPATVYGAGLAACPAWNINSSEI